MLRKIGEKEILNIATLIKVKEETNKVTVDDYAVLNLADISIIVEEEWDKLFTKDVQEAFKNDVGDDIGCAYLLTNIIRLKMMKKNVHTSIIIY